MGRAEQTSSSFKMTTTLSRPRCENSVRSSTIACTAPPAKSNLQNLHFHHARYELYFEIPSRVHSRRRAVQYYVCKSVLDAGTSNGWMRDTALTFDLAPAATPAAAAACAVSQCWLVSSSNGKQNGRGKGASRKGPWGGGGVNIRRRLYAEIDV